MKRTFGCHRPGHALSAVSRLVVVAALAVATIGPSFAQDRESSAVRFINALVDRGWFDLAQIVLDDLAKDSGTPKAVKDQVPFMRANIQIAEGMASQDPAIRKTKIDEASKFFEEFAKKNPGNPMASEARFRIGEIFMQAGDAARARLRDDSADGETRKLDRAEAEERYKRAAAYFGQLKNEFADVPTNPDTGEVDDEALWKLSQSCFLEAKAFYLHGQLYEAGKEKDDMLEKAQKAFTQVNFDFADQFVGFEAAIYLGLTEKERGKLDEAVGAFDAAANLVDVVGRPAKGAAWDPQLQDIVSRALFLKAQLLNERGSFQACLDTAVKQFLDYFEDMVKRGEQLAMALKLEEAKAKNGAGDQKAALKICETVEKTDPQGPIGAMARNMQAQILGKAGGSSAELTPDRALTAADAMIDNGKFHQGMARLRQLIAECEVGNDEARALLPQVWYKLAKLYFDHDRYDEAAACFEQLGRRFPKDALAPVAIFYAANCASRVNGAQPNDYDKNRSLGNLRKLSESYPQHAVSKSAAFLLGNERLGAGDYVAAAAEYAKVTQEAGEFYDAAMYQRAVVLMLEARGRARKKEEAPAKQAFEQALTAFQGTIEWAGKATGVEAGSDRAANLKKLASESWLRVAETRLHPLMKDAAKALEAARAAERVLTEAGHQDRVGEARYYIVQAQLAANDLAGAEAAMTELMTIAPEAKRTADAERDVAVALDAQVLELKKAGKTAEEVNPILARAADHYERWLEVSEKVGQPVGVVAAGRAGDRLFQIAVALNGLPESTFSFTEVNDLTTLTDAPRFRQALKAYQMAAPAPGAPAAPSAPSAPSAPARPGEVNNEPWLILVKCGQCLGFLREYVECFNMINRAVELEKLVVGNQLAVAVAQSKPSLLFAYADAGRAAREASAISKNKEQLDIATAIFQRLVGAAATASELWWRSKYEFLMCLYLKGDYNSASVGLGSLRRTNPNFDNGRLKPLFEALAADLEKKKP